MNRGVLLALGGYICWGLLPLYWKALKSVPALEILAHRIAWSLVFVVLLLVIKRQWSWLKQARQPRVLFTYIASGLILGLNWFIYIWAVNGGHIVEASLGYFINPLVNVMLGVLFLREQLRLGQMFAIAIAASGVLYLTFIFGSFPWIALILAVSFGIYGLIRKTAALNSLNGLTLETAVMFIPALIYLLYLQMQGIAAFAVQSWSTSILLALAGVATALPLLFFAAGARQISMTTLGVLQYVSPTLQFLLGVFLYDEHVPTERWIGFAVIWTALLIYSGESLYRARKIAILKPKVPTDVASQV